MKRWDAECKRKNKNLACPNCRNVLPIGEWNKKLDYEDNRKDTADLLNQLNNYESNNIFNDKNYNGMKKTNKHNLIKYYEKYIGKTIEIFKYILNYINSIHKLLKVENSEELDDLMKNYPLNFHNLEINEISYVIYEELRQLLIYLKNKNNTNINENIIQNNHIINRRGSMNENLLHRRDKNNKIINDNNNILKDSDNNFKDSKKNKNKEIRNNNLKCKEIIKEKRNDIKSNILKVNSYKNEIKLLYNGCTGGKYNILGKKFVENNKHNIQLIINGKLNMLVDEYFLNPGENVITLIIKNKLKNLSYMFQNCSALKNIEELMFLDVRESKSFSYFFSGCSSIQDISPLEYWDVKKCKTFENMFEGCSRLTDIIYLQNWDVSNSINFSYMFYGCSSLSNITPIQNWDVYYCTNFESMFSRCSSLSNIKPLQNWNVSNCKNFEEMFRDCSSLSNIKPLQDWNVSNGKNFTGMFWGCSSLSDVRPLKDWDISNGEAFEDMFYGCSPSINIGVLQTWNIFENYSD